MKARNKRKYKFIDAMAAFMLPVLVLLFSFFVIGIYPFGERSIINNDLYLQYLPIMDELRRAIREGGSILYSFRGGLGTNFYALNCYQNASPITWLFLFIIDENHPALCVTLMILCKTGLASVSMNHYLNEIQGTNSKPEKPTILNSYDRLLLVVLGAMYSLCGYVLAYYYNVMWLEGVILLPIIVLGLRRAVDGYGGKLYTLSLAAMLFVNYYIGAIICIFVILYFLLYILSERKDNIFRITKRIATLTVFAVCMASVVLVPTFYALTKTEDFSEIGTVSSGILYHSVQTHIAQLLPCNQITMVYGPPNLYSGLISLILFFSFIFSKSINKRKRIIKASLVFFIFASTNLRLLDLVWHLFHVPNGIPARYSFMLTFVMMEIAAEMLCSSIEIRKKETIIAVACVLIIFVAAATGINLSDPDIVFMLISGLVLLLLYSIVFLILHNTDKRTFKPYLIVVILLEIVLVSVRSFGSAGVIQHDSYQNHMNEISALTEIAKERDPHARLEIIGTDNFNAPYVYGYKGASIFASSVPQDTYRLLNKLLIRYGEEPETNQFTFNRVGVIPDAMLNIRYYISIDERLTYEWLETIAEKNGCILYENKYHSAPAYAVPGEMQDLDFSQERPEVLKQFVRIRTGKNIDVDENSIDLESWDKLYGEVFDEALIVDKMEGNILSGRINMSKKGILMTNIPYDDGWEVSVDSEKIQKTDSIDCFVSFPLDAGQHEIVMKYRPKGLASGVLISLVAALIYALYEKKLKNY